MRQLVGQEDALCLCLLSPNVWEWLKVSITAFRVSSSFQKGNVWTEAEEKEEK
jgi:hypothetical protein